VKSFDCEMKESKNFSKGLKGIDDIFKKESRAHGVKNGLLVFLSTGMIGCLIYISGYILVNDNQYGFDFESLVTIFMASIFTAMD
jgi:hypothetical protein